MSSGGIEGRLDGGPTWHAARDSSGVVFPEDNEQVPRLGISGLNADLAIRRVSTDAAEGHAHLDDLLVGAEGYRVVPVVIVSQVG